VPDIELRPYQTESASNIRSAFMEGVRGVLLVSPTGSGKTVTFSYITKGASARGNRTLILAHRDTLINQASGKLSEYGVEHGIIMADYIPTPGAMVQVASVQTMVKRVRKQRYDFQLVIVDEAHLSCARTYLEILDALIAANPNIRILGVTGSPCRLDGRGLGTHAGGRYDFLIESVSMRELIDDAYAVQPIVYAPLDRLDLSQVPKEKGDYKKRALSKVMNTSKITGNAIDHYRQYAKHIPAVTWCVDLEHAADTARDFNAAGIKSVMLQGESTTDERDRALRQLADGSIANITFCQLLVEGVDCPAIGCIIGLRPTYSLAATLQTLGRMSRPIYKEGMPRDTREQRFAAMRAGPKGLNGIFLDHAGLTFRHGFQDDIREWSLDGAPKKSKREESVAAKQCPKCRAVFKPEQLVDTPLGPACPVCKHIFQVQKRKLQVEEGQLGELTPEMMAAAGRATKGQRKAEERKAQTLEDFQKIAQERGYSPYWARLQMRMKAAREAREAKEKENQGQLWSLDQLKSLDREAQSLATHPHFGKDWTDI